jgi:hypothetical protein
MSQYISTLRHAWEYEQIERMLIWMENHEKIIWKAGRLVSENGRGGIF